MSDDVIGYFSESKKESQIETYKRIKFLGLGNYAKAYLIQSTLNNIEYVCKDIDLSFSSEQEEKLSLQEVKILKKCKHPNIIGFKEAFITRYPTRALHLVTEYADSGDLHQKIESQKSENKLFSESQIINWLIQVCLALKYIHKLKIIHRDIKPSNIFLTKEDFVKIGDFGVAKALKKDQKNTDTSVGTPLYMPPEVIDSEKYDYKADIWSLGITFFEIMTFTLPFDGNSQMGLFSNIIDFKKKHSFNNNMTIYSEELINIVRKMYSKDPNDRPTIDEILKVPIIRENFKEFVKNYKNKYKEYQIDLDEIAQSIFESNTNKNEDYLITINEVNNDFSISERDNGKIELSESDDNENIKNYNITEITIEHKPKFSNFNESINNNNNINTKTNFFNK